MRDNITGATAVVSKQTLIDFVLEDLRHRNQYLLAIKVHSRFTESHHTSRGEMEWFYRKDHGRIVELDRREFDRLSGESSSRESDGAFVLYAFAYRNRTTLDLIISERWGRRSQGVRLDVRIVRDKLKTLENSIHLLWHRSVQPQT